MANSAVNDFAYKLWEEAGRPEGRDLDFWLEAERRLAPPAKAPSQGEGPSQG